MEKFLPINLTILNSHNSDCYQYYCYLYKAIDEQWISLSSNHQTINTKLLPKQNLAARIYSGYGDAAWRRYSSQWDKEQLLVVDNYTTLMPLQVWDRLYEILSDMPLRSRNTWCKFYLTIYYLCHYHHNDYNIAVSTLATLLGSDRADVSSKILFFIDKGMLRRIGKYSPSDCRSYRYCIPQEYESKPFSK